MKNKSTANSKDAKIKTCLSALAYARKSMLEHLKKNKLMYIGTSRDSLCKMPEYDDDMWIDLVCDEIDLGSDVAFNFMTECEVKKKVVNYEKKNSPKERIKWHLAEAKRLSEKYKLKVD